MNLLATVVDHQMHTTAVVRALEHFKPTAELKAYELDGRIWESSAQWRPGRREEGQPARWPAPCRS